MEKDIHYRLAVCTLKFETSEIDKSLCPLAASLTWSMFSRGKTMSSGPNPWKDRSLSVSLSSILDPKPNAKKTKKIRRKLATKNRKCNVEAWKNSLASGSLCRTHTNLPPRTGELGSWVISLQLKWPSEVTVYLRSRILAQVTVWLRSRTFWFNLVMRVCVSVCLCVFVSVCMCVCVSVYIFKRSPSLNAWTDSLEIWHMN